MTFLSFISVIGMIISVNLIEKIRSCLSSYPSWLLQIKTHTLTKGLVIFQNNRLKYSSFYMNFNLPRENQPIISCRLRLQLYECQQIIISETETIYVALSEIICFG